MANQGDFTSGTVLTADDLNEFSQITIVKASSFTVPNASNTIPTYATEIIDVGGWHAASANNITPDITGIYLITANVTNLNSANRGLVDINVASKVASQDNNDGAYDLSCAVPANVTAGQAISLTIWQNSGSTATPDVTLSAQLIRKTA